jgi:hypothetical protein
MRLAKGKGDILKKRKGKGRGVKLGFGIWIDTVHFDNGGALG